jgi:MscS family membrane protein
LKDTLKFIIIFFLFFFTSAEIPIAQTTDSLNIIQDSTLIPSVDTVKVTSQDSSALEKLSKNLSSKDVMKPPDLRDLISVPKIIWGIIFLAIGYFLIQIFQKLVNLLAERYIRYRLVIKSVIPVIKIFGWLFIIFIIIAGIFQPPLATILAFAASIGVAIGFASQDILKNIFGGITILFDQPFKVGDKIESDKYYGEVVEIGLRSTRIVTPDDSTVSIPNGLLMNQSVSNANSGEPNCQVVAEIFLHVHINTAEIREMAIEAVKVSKYVYLNKPIAVLFSHEVREKRAFLKMKVKAYVLDIRDEFKFKSDIIELVVRELVAKAVID